MSRENVERKALMAFVVMSLLAGGNAVAIRFSNRELDPLWGAAVRFALAALLLAAAMRALQLKLPRGRALTGAVLYGALTFGGAFALAYYALVQLHAGLGQTLLGLVPLVTLLLAGLEREEEVRPRAVAGALIALVGVAVMSSPAAGQAVPALSVLAVIGSTVCFAQGALVVRRFPAVHPLTMNAVGMSVGALLLLVGSLLAGESLVLPERLPTWAAIAYLTVIGSIAVFGLYVFVLRHWPASRVSYEFVLIPVVTLALSVWLDDEPVGSGLVVGGLLVLASVYLGALRSQVRSSTTATD
jgi:drug/metabolite transporter (DMT)-like permease